MSTAAPFAFLVHPRGSHRARTWPASGARSAACPEAIVDTAVRRLPLPPTRCPGSTWTTGRWATWCSSRSGRGTCCPSRTRAARASVGRSTTPRGSVRASSASGRSRRRSPRAAPRLRGRTDIGVTNGNAYTAAIVEDQLLDLVADLSDRRVAVVGATGSVGTTLVRLLAAGGSVDSLLLVARGAAKLEALAAEVGGRVPTTTSTDLHDVRGCDAVVLLTASADALLGAEHLAPGARVLDATQPRNTSPDLAARAARRDAGRRRGRRDPRHAPARRGHRAAARPGVRVLRGDVPARAGRARGPLLDGRADPRPRGARPGPGRPVRAPRVHCRRARRASAGPLGRVRR